MILNGNDIPANSHYDCEVCILGGGVAGLTLATELQADIDSIVLIESGDTHFDTATQRLCFPASNPTQHPDPSYSRLRMLGGSSNHWQNNTSMLSKIDFEKRDWIANSGWPITFDDVSPFYSKAAYYCGTGTDGYEKGSWFEKFGASDIVQGSDVLKSQIAKSSLPPINFYHSYGVTLSESKNVTILKNSNVVDLIFNEKTGEINEVSTLTNTGNQARVNARIFIMCFGGIENARMLLLFNEKYKNKIGNQGDCVGRYYMEHPTPRAAHLFAKYQEDFFYYESSYHSGDRRIAAFLSLKEKALEEHNTINLRMPFTKASQYTLSDGISSYHILSDSMIDGAVPDQFGEHIYNLLGDLDEVVEAISRKKWNRRIFESTNDFGGYEPPLMMEQTPHPESRIRLGKKKDALGLNRCIIDWKLSESDIAMTWKSLELMGAELGALSLGRLKILRERSSRVWGNQLGFSQHHMGATRMSNSASTGVVDKNLRVFGTNNLYIGGSSVFTTGGHVPPTLTITALSIRLAEHLKSGNRNA